MKSLVLKISLALLILFGVASAEIIKQQSFEGDASDTWEYTVSPDTYYNGHPTYSIWSIDKEGLPPYCQPQDGDWLWNAEYTTNENSDIHTMTFNTVDLSNLTGLMLRFYYNAFYYGSGTAKWKGTGDVLGYYVEYDNNSTWNSANYTTIVSADGTTNLTGTDGWVEVIINIPEGSDYLRLQFCVKNSESSEVAAFDYITLTGTDVPLPITLSDFTADAIPSGIELSWETASEIENSGFILYRDNEAIAFIEGAGTSTESHTYSYLDKDVIPGNTYTYVLADLSFNNEEIRHEDAAVSVSVDARGLSDKTYRINGVYPNPFNPQTTLSYELKSNSDVEVSIFNMKGEKVAALFSGKQEPGVYDLNWNAANMKSGIYLIRMSIDRHVETRKLLLVK